MADVEAGADSAEKPKPKAKPAKAKGGGSMGTVIASVIALAAVAMCVFLFMQLSSLKQQLDAGVPQPEGTANDDGHGGEAAVVTDEPGVRGDQLVRYYPLGEFKANTADGKYATMDITLELASYYSRAEYDKYKLEMTLYDAKFIKYLEDLQEYTEKQMKDLHGAVVSGDMYVRAGLAIAVHSAPAAPVEAPTPPPVPMEPRTMLESLLDERTPFLRDNIITLINSHNAVDIVSPEGKEAFKQSILDSLNSKFLEDDVGTVKAVLFSDILTA
jgi:flagellar basal body-associated protein FliL